MTYVVLPIEPSHRSETLVGAEGRLVEFGRRGVVYFNVVLVYFYDVFLFGLNRTDGIVGRQIGKIVSLSQFSHHVL